MPEQKEPFVSKEDRPEVKLPDPDQPVSELRVRDLQSILGAGILKKIEIKEPIKDFKIEKLEHKEWFKDFKDHKHEKWEHKEPFKDYKDHKPEHGKEFKLEKIEVDPLKQTFEPGPDPTQLGDPAVLAGLTQIIETVGGLTKRVDELANQVAELQKKAK